jgi:hypothetical protein
MTKLYENLFIKDLKLWNNISSEDVLFSVKSILISWMQNDYNTEITRTWITKYDLLTMQISDHKSNLKSLLFNALLSKNNFESILEIDKDNSVWDRFSVMIMDALSSEMANRWASKLKKWEFSWIDSIRIIRLIDYCIRTNKELFTISDLILLYPHNASIINKIKFIWLINEYDLDYWFQKIIELLWSESIWESEIDEIFSIKEIFEKKNYRDIIKEKFRNQFTINTKNDFILYESIWTK